MTLTSGLYGLFRLDGAIVDAADAVTLGLDGPGALCVAIAKGVDAADPGVVHRSDRDGCVTILAGFLSDAEGLAECLKLTRSAGHADLALAAFHRFGSDAPVEMPGEWTFLHWERGGRLTLMASGARRDRLFYAHSGGRCAVAPDLFRLAGLPWVGRELDEAGLLMQIGRGDLRGRTGRATMLRKVRQLMPAETVTISASGVESRRADVLPPQPRWTGTFDDALADAEALLNRIVRGHVARTAAPALLLSGGLDSSLLAWAAASNRRSGQPLHLLTSVAPPGSGLADEQGFATIVARALGLECIPVFPLPAADPYRPSPDAMRGANGPPLSNRQPLTEAFHAAARAAGATMLLNGMYGEYSLTGRLPGLTLRQRIGGVLRQTLRGRVAAPAPDGENPFHARLSASRRETLPDKVRAALAAPPPPPYRREPGELWGYGPGIDRVLGHPNEFRAGALRMEYPYRDVRLLRLFAGLPTSFLRRDGYDRAPARHMLDGRLPDSIRLRRRGMPASPDHMVRLQRQAPAARGRIAAFRRAEVDEWFDLDWLDQALARVAERGPADVAEANEVQLTAINAEFLTWWRTGD